MDAGLDLVAGERRVRPGRSTVNRDIAGWLGADVDIALDEESRGAAVADGGGRDARRRSASSSPRCGS